ncbi:hypothetical protein SEA_FIZZLES_24 [Microbacterium phage Fizzles]|nr:hypothetical protein SEA_FIZZLES_24 [Microbacterium phage Fizzles]
MCGCKKNSVGQPQLWKVTLPGGVTKVYSSDIAARAKVSSTPGATLTPPSGATV